MSFYNNIKHYLLRAQGYTAKIYLQGKFSTLIKIEYTLKQNRNQPDNMKFCSKVRMPKHKIDTRVG